MFLYLVRVNWRLWGIAQRRRKKLGKLVADVYSGVTVYIINFVGSNSVRGVKTPRIES